MTGQGTADSGNAGAGDNVLQQKSKNQLKNEAKKAEKMKKFEEKIAKVGDLAEKARPKAKAAAPAYAASQDQAAIPETPYGDKKDMSLPMQASYSPSQVEAAWYAWWEKSGFFTPEYRCAESGSSEREKFVMVLPPPNVTGSLHVGHAMMGSIEDALSRWHRMCGKEVLFLPGCDHAGIATQAVVEKKLMKERNVTRHDLGREAFLKEVWLYKEQYGDRIYQQLRRLGASLDWTRACFTLDEKANAAVTEAFVRMFEDGLIFRANRLVNWSGKLQTALSDLEVDSLEIEPGSWHAVSGHKKAEYQFGVMTSFAYVAEEGPGEIVISTTRPETVFADTAVAVNGGDARYAQFHGRRVIHPITGKPLPVIVDDVADPEFGTGALKVSPGHDHTDFAVGQRHGLQFLSVFDENNILNAQCGQFAGMARYDAREAVIAHAKANGTFRGEQPHAMSLPVCSRSGDFVEPRMMPQWWCKCAEMARVSCDAVRDGRIAITPKEHEKVWFNWLENIHDWCLSRQLWWGHRIPAYRAVVDGADDDVWIAARSHAEALAKARARFPGASDITLEQDPDVLDTWFSSGLWPFSTLGWPEKTADLDRFFPTTLLETGGDILFFWVARMVMMSMYLTGKAPFSQVFLHAIIRDAHGRKMSKSLGNVVDPIDVIQGITLAELHAALERGNLDRAEVDRAKEGQRRDFPNGIPECGTDALRFALCSYVAHGRDVNLNINKVEAYRKFCNKLWNACKFALLKLGADFVPDAAFTPSGAESSADKWILQRLNRAAVDANAGFAAYNLMNATGAIYSFWLYELCDVYIEVAKPMLASPGPAAHATRQVLYLCIEQGLRLLHPFMPFVTEELYQRLPRRPASPFPSICVSPYPQPCAEWDAFDVTDFARLFELTRAVRSMAAEERLPKNVTIRVATKSLADASLMRAHEAQMAALVKAVGALDLVDAVQKAPLRGFEETTVSFIH